MKIVDAMYDKAVFIAKLDDCIAISTLEGTSAFLDADQIKELIKELETRLKEMNNEQTS